MASDSSASAAGQPAPTACQTWRSRYQPPIATSSRFEQLGPPPRCRPGESVRLAFRYVSDLPRDDAALQVKASDVAEPFSVDFAPRTMRSGDEATMTVRMRADHPWYPEGEIGSEDVG